MSPCRLCHLIRVARVATLLDVEMAVARTVQGTSSALFPIMGVVFAAFLITGIAMPVLPLHVHEGLGLGTFIVGLIAGSPFAAALVSRVAAGRGTGKAWIGTAMYGSFAHRRSAMMEFDPNPIT